MWFLTTILNICGFLPIAETSIQCYEHDEITVKVPDRKATIEIGRPPTLDLNATGAVFSGWIAMMS